MQYIAMSLEQKDHHKYLGVITDDNISWITGKTYLFCLFQNNKKQLYLLQDPSRSITATAQSNYNLIYPYKYRIQ